MENNIYNKTGLNNMIKKILFMLSLFLVVSSTFALNQNKLLEWKFEEGLGTIALDSSGNNNYGIISQANKYYTSNCLYGSFCLKFDGNNDYISTITPKGIPDTLTIVVNSYKESQSGERMIWLIGDDIGIEHFELYYNGDINQYFLEYLDNNSILKYVVLENVSSTIIYNNYQNLIVTIKYPENDLMFYRNGILTYNQTLSDKFVSQDTNNFFRMGTDFNILKDYKGWFDDTSIFDFELNTSQINSLIVGGYLPIGQLQQDIPIVNETLIDTINNMILINYTLPTNETIQDSLLVSFEGKLNQLSSCDIYIDNQLINSFSNILAYNFQKEFTDLSNHTTFTYCNNVINGSLNYELTPEYGFTIQKPSKTIDFSIYDINKVLLDREDLYLFTPCPVTSFFMTNNDVQGNREFYIQKLDMGLASYNLSYTNEYEFCLVKGKINYQDDFFSTKYSLADVEKVTTLGNLFVGNETLTYSLIVDEEDLYKVTSLDFWGQTKSSFFQMLMGIIVGGIIILVGIITKFEKLAVVGVFVIIAGFGVSVMTFVGALI